MDEFLLIFRRDFTTREVQPSPEQMQQHLQQWQQWFAELTETGKLARPLQRWDGKGVIVNGKKEVTNGPYAEIKESIGGMVLIKAADYQQAAEIAKGCPILTLDGTVEIRRAASAG